MPEFILHIPPHLLQSQAFKLLYIKQHLLSSSEFELFLI